MRFFIHILAIFWVTSVSAEALPGSELLSYFSSNCRTQGEWTRSALADSKALIETLRSLSQDPDCRSLAGSISQLEILNQQLQTVQNLNATQVQLSILNSKEQELMIQLSQTSDTSVQTEINAKLRDLQVQRAALDGALSVDSISGPDKAALLMGIIQTANSSFSQIVGNQTCLKKNSNVLKSVTSIISSIGATAAVVNPALGLGITAGSAFLGQTIEGLRQNTNSRQIRRISENSVAFEAYKCALETMSERWCQMKDAEAFLNFKASFRQRPLENSTLASAIRLNDREIPVLLEWLTKIRAGVTPTTTADAGRQSNVFQRDAVLRSLEAYGLGLIEENRQLYNSYNDLNERWSFLRSLIITLIPSVAPNNIKNPLYDVIPVGYTPYFLLNLADDSSIRNNQGAYIDFNSWSKPTGFNPTLDLVKEKYLEWVQKTRIRVNQELTQVLQPDALQTLSSAYERSGNRWKLSPMDSLRGIITFLKLHPPREDSDHFNLLYESTIKKLSEVYEITQNAVIAGQSETIIQSPVEQIYEITQLKYGTVVIQARLDMVVRLAILELIENSSSEDQVLVAQLLAAERFTETLTKMSGTDNLALIKADINRAQPITISNLNSFNDIFGKNIQKLLKKLKKEEQQASGSIAKAKRYARTEMCFLMLTVPTLKETLDLSLCEGLKFTAVIPGGPSSPTLSQDTFKQDFNDRACVYRDHFRRSKIFENWGIK
jgi:hypothetical protein